MAIVTKTRDAFEVTYYDENGQLKETLFSEEKEAIKFKKKANKIALLPLKITDKTNYAEFLYEFINKVMCLKSSASAISTKNGLFNNYMHPAIKNHSIGSIDENISAEILNTISTTTPIASPYNVERSVLSNHQFYDIYRILLKSFDYLVINEIVKTNPFTCHKVAKENKEKHETIWSLDLFNQVIKKCDDKDLYIFLHLLFYTGLNVSTTLALQISNLGISEELLSEQKCYIEAKAKILRIRKKFDEQINEKLLFVLYETENNKICLIKLDKPIKIQIPNNIANLLLAYTQEKQEIYRTTKLPYKFLFSHRDGYPIDESAMNKRFDAIKPGKDFRLKTLISFGKIQTKQTLGQVYYYQLNDELQLPSLNPQKYNLKNPDIFVRIRKTFSFKERIDKSLPNENDVNLNMFIDLINSNPEFKAQLLSRIKEAT